MSARYRASAALESFIVHSAPRHYATDNAPQTEAQLADMVLSLKAGDAIPVWNGGSEQTIYSTPEVNFAFRAWHDSLHIKLGAGFDAKGELAVARAHIVQASLKAPHLTDLDLRALWADTWGQFEHAQRTGAFPIDQAAFVAARLAA